MANKCKHGFMNECYFCFKEANMSGCHPTDVTSNDFMGLGNQYSDKKEVKEKSATEIIYDSLTLHADRILRLEEQLGRQIVENRKISSRVDELNKQKYSKAHYENILTQIPETVNDIRSAVKNLQDRMDSKVDEQHTEEIRKVGCPHCGRFFNR